VPSTAPTVPGLNATPTLPINSSVVAQTVQPFKMPETFLPTPSNFIPPNAASNFGTSTPFFNPPKGSL
jgi:hypothetical protein